MIRAQSKLLEMRYGEPIQWWRAMGHCPCFVERTGEYDRTHGLCGGTGILREEVDVSRFRAIVTEVREGRNFSGIGPLEAGDLTISTWPNQIALAADDYVVVPSRSRVATKVMIRGATPADDLGYGTVLEIDRIFDINGPITAHYSVVGSTVTWDTGHGPDAGAQYSVRFRYSPQWSVVSGFITDRPPDLNGKPLPRVVGLKLVPPVL